MKKLLIALATLALVAAVQTAEATEGTTTGTVTVTVAIATITISVSPDWDIGAVDYVGTPIGSGADYFTATNTNTSNTPVDFSIAGASSTTGAKMWAIGAAAGAGTFLLQCTGGDLTADSLDTPQDLKTGVAIAGDVTFSLDLTLPTDAAVADGGQTIAATVTASIAGS